MLTLVEHEVQVISISSRLGVGVSGLGSIVVVDVDVHGDRDRILTLRLIELLRLGVRVLFGAGIILIRKLFIHLLRCRWLLLVSRHFLWYRFFLYDLVQDRCLILDI